MKKLFFFLIISTIYLSQSLYPNLSKTHPNINKYKLIVGLYNEVNFDRANEYITCMAYNYAHELIDEIHVIYDTSKDDGENKLLTYLKSLDLKISYINNRPTYGYCFELANKLYPHCRIILSNADIYFNETLKLLDDYDLTNKFLALTRWNVLNDGSIKLYFAPDGKKSEFSQDTWIFKTPLKQIIGDKIYMGIPGCDGKIVRQANLSGLGVSNPCLSIQCCHLHLTDIRNYSKIIDFSMSDLMKVPWEELNQK